MTDDQRLFAPSAARNMQPVCDVLQPLLPKRGTVLEIASGSGEHIVKLAELTPETTFQPSDPGEDERRSIDAWRQSLKLDNVQPAISIDATASQWPIASADVVYCMNMIHISPWAATVGLIEGAARTLATDGLLYTYGPYRRDGRHTSTGNETFDQSLRQRNPEWGIRDVEEIISLAESHGFRTPDIVEMPANNLSLLFRRT